MNLTYIVIVPLNDLKEESWAILHVLGEDLQQIATFVIVHKDFQLLYVQLDHSLKTISLSDDLMLLDLSTFLDWFHTLYIYSIFGDSYYS